MRSEARRGHGPHHRERDRVAEMVRQRAASIVDLAASAVRIPSDLPEHTEAGVVELLRETAIVLDLPAGQVLATAPGRPNLVLRMPGPRSGRTLLLTGHTDTKPAGRREAWDGEPRSGRIQDGRLMGLGAGDMKAALAAMLHAAAILRQLGEPCRGELVLAFTGDEEANGEIGLHDVLDVAGLGADGAVIGEPAGLFEPFDQIGLASRGFFGFTLRVKGTARHSSVSNLIPTVNPVEKLAAVVADLRRQPILADRLHPLFPTGITLNVATGIAGGVAPGTVPEIAESVGDVRLLPGMAAEEARSALQRALDRLGQADADLRVELLPDVADWPGAEIEPDHSLARSVLAVASEVLGRAVPPGGFPGATEAHLLTRLGIPTIPAAGPGVIARAHAPNEWVEVDAIAAATTIYALVALDFLHEVPIA